MIYVALLRGINVGGNNTVSMAALKLSFEKLEYKNVTTYINSGNVIFTDDKDQRSLEDEIEKELVSTCGFPIRVVVKNFEEIQKIINSIPKNWDTQSDWRHNVIFLSHRIDSKEQFGEFIPRPEIEEMQYVPGALLWAAKTSDLTDSTMITLNKSKLYKEMTVRNLNTARKIYELMKNLH